MTAYIFHLDLDVPSRKSWGLMIKAMSEPLYDDRYIYAGQVNTSDPEHAFALSQNTDAGPWTNPTRRSSMCGDVVVIDGFARWFLYLGCSSPINVITAKNHGLLPILQEGRFRLRPEGGPDHYLVTAAQVTKSNAGSVFYTEASDLGLPPGLWPTELFTDIGSCQPFKRVSSSAKKTTYVQSEPGRAVPNTLVIFND